MSNLIQILRVHLPYWLRHDPLLYHVFYELVWYLFEDFLGQHAEVASLLEVLKLDELDDVADGGLSPGVSDSHLIAVQLLHVGEIGIAYAHDDDRERVLGTLNDKICGLRHVMDDAISQNEKDVVHLSVDLSLHVLEDG